MTLFSVLLVTALILPEEVRQVMQPNSGVKCGWYITCILDDTLNIHLVVTTMMTIEEQVSGMPTRFPVAVIMQQSPSRLSAWSDYQWHAVGITVVQNDSAATKEPVLVNEQGDVRQYLYHGFNVSLHLDECESYYYNLISSNPRCYVLTRNNEDEVPVPFLVSMSFDEAHAYLESDEEVYDVDIPPELYRWLEAYVLTHYVAVKRKKRKRQDWKHQHTSNVKT